MRLKPHRGVKMTKNLGSIRRVDCVEAELVTADGVYLSFRLPPEKRTLNHLVEVRRSRLNMRQRESILVDAHTLGLARRAALEAILRHRVAMHLLPRVDAPQEKRPFQLRLI